MTYDIILIHPPALYDFRERVSFPGPIAYTVPESTDQFMIPPVGMLSIAAFLHKNGYNVIVDNLCDRMVHDRSFDAEHHIKTKTAKLYAVGLHWAVHSQGAIEVAKLCKKLHPDSAVILGGLTATRFHVEAVRKFGFVDAVVRGEGEEPLLEFAQTLEKSKEIQPTRNATIRDRDGRIRVGEMMEPKIDINELDFTRLDLMEPKRSAFSADMPPHWSLPVCRGCSYGCISCGGSAYSYKTYLGKKRPSFRSPDKIVEDLKKLSEQGIRLVFLFQDARMGGEGYSRELARRIREEKLQLTGLSMELFDPAGEDYMRELSRVDVPLTLTMSPESGVDSVRMAHRRNYTNEELFRTIETCQALGVHLIAFFMLALGNETRETVEETWKLWEKICLMDKAAQSELHQTTVNYAFGPMILLDPGSSAFDFPGEHGYTLIYKDLEDHVNGLSRPSWHQWLNYETRHLDRDEIIELMLKSIERSIDLREKYGIYDRAQAAMERAYHVYANRFMIKEVERAMKISNEDERRARLDTLKKTMDGYTDKLRRR